MLNVAEILSVANRLKAMVLAVPVLLVMCQPSAYAQLKHGHDWGDLGNGYYANPILPSDYSDMDVIRVDSKYYMVSSEFHFMGMPVLESDDMVNWRIVSHVYNSINLPGYNSMEKFGEGTWAPSIRYHAGVYYIYVCTPKEGLLVATASHPVGPWSRLRLVQAAVGWQDPCPYWDENGNAYLGRSIVGSGAIYVHKMSADGMHILDDGVKIYEGPVAQGTKLYRRGRYVYMSISEGGVGTGWQKVLRSKNIYGPYKGKRVLEKGSTSVNGPSQGAFVDTPAGDWWFYHYQYIEPLGRIVHLQPVRWEEGFPVVGKDYDGNGIGEPVSRHRMPIKQENKKANAPQHDDDFDSGVLGLQWQCNHNASLNHISVGERKGWLKIRSLPAKELRMARNQLSQKLIGYYGSVNVTLDFSEMVENQRAGLECIGRRYNGAGVTIVEKDGETSAWIYFDRQGNIDLVEKLPKDCKVVHLSLEVDAVENVFAFRYSVDGKEYKPCGRQFSQGTADFKGTRVGLYSYSLTKECGDAYFDDFRYDIDGPGFLFTKEK